MCPCISHLWRESTFLLDHANSNLQFAGCSLHPELTLAEPYAATQQALLLPGLG